MNAVYNHLVEDAAKIGRPGQLGDRRTPGEEALGPGAGEPAASSAPEPEPPAFTSLFTKVSAEARAAPARVADCIDAADRVARVVFGTSPKRSAR